MARVSPILTNFSAGEISPELYGRVDIAKYANACRTLKNFIVRVHGGAQRRPGRYFVSEVKNSAKRVRLIPFEFSTTQAYSMEFGDKYIRFYMNQGQIVVAYAAWAATTAYALGDLATSGGNYYRCIIAHTSGSAFATDLAAGKWEATGGADDLAYEIPSPYLEADLPLLKYHQDSDIMYIFHPTFAPRKLTRTGHAAWTLTTVTFVDGPYLDQNTVTDVGVNLAPDGDFENDTGCISVSTPTTQERSNDGAYSGAYSRKFVVDGAGEGFTHGAWNTVTGKKYRFRFRVSTLAVNIRYAARKGDNSGYAFEESVNAVPSNVWTEYTRYYKETAGGAWAHAEFTNATGTTGTFYVDLLEVYEVDTIFLTPSAKTGTGITLTATDALFVAGHVGGFFRIKYGEDWGYVKITAVASATSATADVLSELSGTSPTPEWCEGAWSTKNGWPAGGTFYEQRMVGGGSPALPQTVSASKSANYEDMTPDVDDSAAFNYKIGSRQANVIRWLSDVGPLIVGTTGGIFSMGSPDNSTPLTPSNKKATRANSVGAADIQPVNIGSSLLYVERFGIPSNPGRRINELSYVYAKQNYDATDLTLLSEHITKTGIVEIAYMQSPNPILWALRTDGLMIACTFERVQDVIAWHQHPTDGLDESICVIPGANQDELWIATKRTIGGATKRYIEFMKEFDWGVDQEDGFFVDSGLTYDGAPATTVAGLDHLEGETVSVLADGAVHNDRVVTSGQIALEYPASVIHAGLPYVSDLETMNLEGGAREGTSQGKMQRIHSAGIMVKDAGGVIYAGPDTDNLEAIIARTTSDNVGEGVPLVTDTIEAGMNCGWDVGTRVFIRQASPCPLTVLAIMPRFRTEDR